MSKPTKPRWADGDPSYIIEPSGAKKTLGWLAGEKPPNQFFNWLHYIYHSWIEYFENKAETISPTYTKSAATATWNGSVLTFASPIDISFRVLDKEQINRISAGTITLADGEVFVFRKNKTDPSPVVMAAGVYPTLGVGQYAIVADNALSSSQHELEVVLFRRRGTDLECPVSGLIYKTGDTIEFGKSSVNAGALTIDASQVTSGTFADARIAASNVTQHQGLLALDASQITSGTFADARIAASNVTQHQGSLSIAETQIPDGAILARVGGNEAITGTWTFNTALPTSSLTPSADAQLSTKKYVDDSIGAIPTVNTYDTGYMTWVKAALLVNAAAHGLGGEPTDVTVFIKCTINDQSYTAGQVLIWSMNQNAVRGFAIQVDSTHISIRAGSNEGEVPRWDTGTSQILDLNNTKWDVRFLFKRVV